MHLGPEFEGAVDLSVGQWQTGAPVGHEASRTLCLVLGSPRPASTGAPSTPSSGGSASWSTYGQDAELDRLQARSYR